MASVTTEFVGGETPVYIPPTTTGNTEGAIPGSSPASTGLTGGSGIGFNAGNTSGIGLNPGADPNATPAVAGDGNSNGTGTGNNTAGNITPNPITNLSASSIIAPIATSIIPNPLHQFASSTYALSLWWLDVRDFNALTDPNNADIGTGTNFQLGPFSYVVAEDSGLYPQRRLPTQVGLNYNIQNVTFDTVVGLNSKSKSSNMVTGSMTIAEPYGVTFLDSLVRASGITGTYQNYTQQPYMLQVDFTGYDDTGTPVPSSQTSIYRKRFPIHITGIKVDVTDKGAEYKVDFVPMGHIAYIGVEHSTVPKDLTINAKTVQGFFDAFTNSLNAFWQLEALDKKVQYADSIVFNIDPAIGSRTIVYDKQMSIAQANPNSKQIDLSQGNFSIPAGTQIQEVITRLLQQSDYIIGQLGLDLQNTDASTVQTSSTQILNTFKTTIQTNYIGTDSSGATLPGAFDNVRNTYPKQFTYNILQYHVYDAKHPAAPTLSDPRPYVVKQYNYLYTGKNLDITDLKIHFDSTFHTAINAYTNQLPSTDATASTAVDTILGNQVSLLLSPQLLGSLNIIPGLNQVPNLTPNRYRNIVNDQRDNALMNTIKNPSAQTAANVMKSLYTNQSQEMVSVDLSILGDPTLIKQDDWLYSPNPRGIGNNVVSQFFGQFSQSTIAQKYGQIKMDGGELMVTLTVNTPIDIDTDWTNRGLVFPQPGTVPSLFSGLYRVHKIKNDFTGGKFSQVLSLVRHSMSDIITSSAPSNASNGRDATTDIQSGLNSTNQTVAGKANTLGLSAGETVVDTTALPAATSTGESVIQYGR